MNDPSAAPEAAERRSRQLGMQLRALVVEHLDEPELDADVGGYPGGAALVAGDVAWVLIDGPAGRSLGGALAWALRHDATELHLVASADTGSLARRAARLRFPVTVWFAEGRTLLPAVAEPLAPADPPSPEHLALCELIEQAGAVPNVEHGVVFGEVRGLEVCRVVDEPTVGHIAELGDVGLALDDGPEGRVDAVDRSITHLEVGVGANDREAFRLLHGDIPTVEALAGVVDAVVAHRSDDAPQHPLNRLGQERFLRWRLEQDPSLVGLATVAPAQPPSPRPNLKDPIPCVAVGTDADGETVTVVCTFGVDLDVVGYVADVFETAPGRVVVAAPERDLLPIMRELLGQLSAPVDVVAVG
ncbi:MAG: hypothetical protein WBP59_09820 [Ilumatobacteraceae bacterium]